MTKYYTKSNINYGGQEVMPNTEKRLEGWNKDIAKTVHSIIQKEALTSHELYLFVKDLIDQALAEERDRVREWLKAEKATYSEDVAQRERTVYDHIIKCFGEYSLNKAKEE